MRLSAQEDPADEVIFLRSCRPSVAARNRRT